MISLGVRSLSFAPSSPSLLFRLRSSCDFVWTPNYLLHVPRGRVMIEEEADIPTQRASAQSLRAPLPRRRENQS